MKKNRKVADVELGRAVRSALDAWRSVTIEPVPSLPEWARQYRILPGEVTARPGPFSYDLTPWMIDPSLDVDDLSVSELALCFCARAGKTELMMNLIGRTIHRDPRNILVVYPDLDKAKKWSSMFFEPMSETTPVLRGKLANRHAKDGDNTALRKKYPGGFIIGTGAQSPSSFRQVQAAVILCDEVDGYEMTREGDPLQLAFSRAENYPDAVKVVASTPTDEGTSRIWQWLEKSDFRKWHVRSRKGRWFVLDWEHLVWDEGRPETARIQDPDTKEAWTPEERKERVRAGKWIATQPFNGVRGYWLNGMVSLFAPSRGHATKEHQFAADFLKAKAKGKETLRVWQNLFRALPWREEAEELDWERVRDRAEDYGCASDEVPERVLMVTCAADVQADRIELEWVGWSDDYESFGLSYTVLVGDTKREQVWASLADEVRRVWKHPSGKVLRLVRGLVDEGGEGSNAQVVRKWCVQQMAQGIPIQPCKGIGRSGSSEPELVTMNPNRSQRGVRAPTFNVGTNRAKRTIYAHLFSECPGPHTMHFPEGRGYDDRWYQMLVSERVITKQYHGVPYKVFELPAGRRNEALDIRVYNYAAAVSLNPSWESLRRVIGGSVEVPKRRVSKSEPERVEAVAKHEQKREDEAVSVKPIQGLTKAPAQSMPNRRRPEPRGSGWATSY
jgi:phage terminase large subunit GpA-like protein